MTLDDLNKEQLLENKPNKVQLSNSTSIDVQSTKDSTNKEATSLVYVDGKRRNVLPFIHRFCVPGNLFLEDLLAGGAYEEWLKPKRLRKLYVVLSLIHWTHLTNSKGIKRNGFVPIASKALRRHLGKDLKDGKALYKHAIAILEQIGVLEVNHRYQANTKDKGGFSKSFRFTKPYWNQQTKTVELAQPKPAPIKDLSRLTNPVQSFIHQNLAALVMDERALSKLLLHTADAEEKIYIEHHAERFRRGAFNVKGGRNQKRVTHRLTSCPREMRPVFRLKDKQLFEYDIPCCQPTLLLHFGSQLPEAEVYKYRLCLTGDIYKSLGPSRDAGKTQFLKFAFGAYKRPNEFGENFSKRFPTLARIIRGFPQKDMGGQTLSCFLQDLEAEICIYSVVQECMKQGVFVVPVHDSFIIRRESYSFISSLVDTEFRKRFGFGVDLKQKTPCDSNYTTWAEFCRREAHRLAA